MWERSSVESCASQHYCAALPLMTDLNLKVQEKDRNHANQPQ